jgi:hypothetical protein
MRDMDGERGLPDASRSRDADERGAGAAVGEEQVRDPGEFVCAVGEVVDVGGQQLRSRRPEAGGGGGCRGVSQDFAMGLTEFIPGIGAELVGQPAAALVEQSEGLGAAARPGVAREGTVPRAVRG